jgi:hypothetical protein
VEAALLVVVGPVIKPLDRGGSNAVGRGRAGYITVRPWW